MKLAPLLMAASMATTSALAQEVDQNNVNNNHNTNQNNVNFISQTPEAGNVTSEEMTAAIKFYKRMAPDARISKQIPEDFTVETIPSTKVMVWSAPSSPEPTSNTTTTFGEPLTSEEVNFLVDYYRSETSSKNSNVSTIESASPVNTVTYKTVPMGPVSMSRPDPMCREISMGFSPGYIVPISRCNENNAHASASVQGGNGSINIPSSNTNNSSSSISHVMTRKERIAYDAYKRENPDNYKMSCSTKDGSMDINVNKGVTSVKATDSTGTEEFKTTSYVFHNATEARAVAYAQCSMGGFSTSLEVNGRSETIKDNVEFYNNIKSIKWVNDITRDIKISFQPQ